MRQIHRILESLLSVSFGSQWRRKGQRVGSGVLAIATLILCLVAQPGVAIDPEASPALPATASLVAEAGSSQVESGQRLYESGQFAAAIEVLEQAVESATQSGDTEVHIQALRNLALVYQQLRQFDAANRAINTARSILDAAPFLQQATLQGSVLDVQGGIQFSQGQADAALQTWTEAAEIYDAIGNDAAALQNQINQAQALQKLGFYRRAIALLSPITAQLQTQPDSPAQAIALRSLGDALRFVGDLDQSHTVLETSGAIAQRLQRPDLADSAQLSLANTIRAQGRVDAALSIYRTLAQTTASEEIRVQALSNRVSLLVETGQTIQAQALWPTVQTQFANLSPSQSALLARVKVAQSYIQAGVTTNPGGREIAAFLAIAIQQAQTLGDIRSESYAFGTLALLYEQADESDEQLGEQSGHLATAKMLNDQALQLAQTANATDISYLWQWHLGRIYKAEGDRTGDKQNYAKAIGAYSEAVNTLQQLRTDLVAVNAQVQVSFQESVEPIHRELVSLLLDEERGDPTPATIEKARQVIESLQLAELDNFFREACLDTQTVEVDQLDPNAAVIYPILLSDRLEIVLSLPNQALRHYTSPISRIDVEDLIDQLRRQLTFRVGNAFRPGMATLYNWLIRPLAADLETSQISTVVFVLDGVLRNVPMAALYDGTSYLIEHYNIALTPGLQLVNPQPLQEQALGVLTGALSESRQGFSALPNVVPEVEQIQLRVPAEILLNEAFTQAAIKAELQATAKPIVHLATHGKFASNNEETFILTWDGQLDITELNDVLQASEITQKDPIELLVLSACQTAVGDKQAALGLAGMAVRAGARSTIATLWQVSDEATAFLMEELYAQLSSGSEISKAEALRQAQIKVLQEPRFRQHPFYWAPYVLVGNWL
ncbi:MAG: CHAT domain-containing protein [Cyanothece sp. SIO2G6]|nr:CHAT domain-containing protein [Cyanothece sp. SIO2G6]